jgi:hypothetical protein
LDLLKIVSAQIWWVIPATSDEHIEQLIVFQILCSPHFQIVCLLVIFKQLLWSLSQIGTCSPVPVGHFCPWQLGSA